MDGQELICQYIAGGRDFRDAALTGFVLYGLNLSRASDLEGAILPDGSSAEG